METKRVTFDSPHEQIERLKVILRIEQNQYGFK